MKITRADEYGLRLVMRLAAGGVQLTVRELAGSEQLPVPTVAKLLCKLRRAGLVSAVRGRNGGYALSRPAGKITVAEVLAASGRVVFDDGSCEHDTSRGSPVCARSPGCRLRSIWGALATVIDEFLAGVTLEDVILGHPPSGQGLPALAAEKR